MNAIARLLVLPLCLAALSGCATYYTNVVRDNPAPYAGTRLDARVLAHYWSLGHVWCGLPSCADSWLFIGDLPLSFVADTLVLPFNAVPPERAPSADPTAPAATPRS